jgi:type VII secretion effector (TIGR04197 family)
MAEKISSNTGLASSYANKIKAKVGPLSSSKSVTGGSETNLSAKSRCESCFDKKNTLLSGYAASTNADAAQLVKIAGAFETLDRKLAKKAGRT